MTLHLLAQNQCQLILLATVLARKASMYIGECSVVVPPPAWQNAYELGLGLSLGLSPVRGRGWHESYSKLGLFFLFWPQPEWSESVLSERFERFCETEPSCWLLAWCVVLVLVSSTRHGMLFLLPTVHCMRSQLRSCPFFSFYFYFVYKHLKWLRPGT